MPGQALIPGGGDFKLRRRNRTRRKAVIYASRKAPHPAFSVAEGSAGMVGLLLPLAGITYLTYADLTQSLHASVTYPLSLDISGARVSGAAEEQVFQIGNSAADGPVSVV